MFSPPGEEHETGVEHKRNEDTDDDTGHDEGRQRSFAIFAAIQIVRPVQPGFVHLKASRLY